MLNENERILFIYFREFRSTKGSMEHFWHKFLQILFYVILCKLDSLFQPCKELIYTPVCSVGIKKSIYLGKKYNKNKSLAHKELTKKLRIKETQSEKFVSAEN